MAKRIKKGDTVIILKGKDRDKKGKVLKLIGETLVVEKINVVKRHQKPSQSFQGGIIEKPGPVHGSNVMLVCPKCNESSKIKFNKVENKKVRVCKSCNEVVDKLK